MTMYQPANPASSGEGCLSGDPLLVRVKEQVSSSAQLWSHYVEMQWRINGNLLLWHNDSVTEMEL